MPCDRWAKVYVIQKNGFFTSDKKSVIGPWWTSSANDIFWGRIADDAEQKFKDSQVIGWRYADEPPKPASSEITADQIAGWIDRHDWGGSESAARAAIDDARSLHLS